MAIVQDDRLRGGLALGGTVLGGTILGAGTTRFTDLGGRQGVTPEVAGAVSGVGGTAVLRETVDVIDGEQVTLIGDPGTTLGRVGSPSAAWGLGGGGLFGLLWALNGPLDMDFLPDTVSDFGFWGAITGVPAGVVSAVLPKQPTTAGGGGGGEAAPGTTRTLKEVATNGGQEEETQQESEFPTGD